MKSLIASLILILTGYSLWKWFLFKGIIFEFFLFSGLVLLINGMLRIYFEQALRYHPEESQEINKNTTDNISEVNY